MDELMRALLCLPEPASEMARRIDHLHFAVIGTSTLGAIAVAVIIAVFLGRYRAPLPALDGGPVHPRLRGVAFRYELAVISGLLGLFLLFWVIGFRQYVAATTPPRDTLDIYVVAKQWMWTFAYPDGTVSNGELQVPAGRAVKLLMTSRDVIHSFYVPDLRIKQDVVPGRMTTTWFEASAPGEHDIFCAEMCGDYHSTMRARLVVLSAERYAAAEARRDRPGGAAGDADVSIGAPDLATAGERIAADKGCLRCHTVDGTPHIGPTWAGLYGSTVPLLAGGQVIADEAFLTESMMDPGVKIHLGYPPVMPSYLGQLSAPDAAAVVAFIRSLAERTP